MATVVRGCAVRSATVSDMIPKRLLRSIPVVVRSCGILLPDSNGGVG